MNHHRRFEHESEPIRLQYVRYVGDRQSALAGPMLDALLDEIGPKHVTLFWHGGQLLLEKSRFLEAFDGWFRPDGEPLVCSDAAWREAQNALRKDTPALIFSQG